MTTLAHFLSLLISAFFFKISLSSDVPVQVDLVFPKSNAIYQPVYPFPIVFALHNFSTAWKYKPTVAWKLTTIDNLTNQEAFVGIGSTGWNEKEPTWGPPPDKFLAINSSGFISRTNQSAYILEYNFFLDTLECSGPTYPPKKIYFNTSITSGSIPDLTTFGSCPPPVRAITIKSQNQSNETCTQLSSPQPDPIPCAFRVDQQAFDQISKKMVEDSKCHNVTWPETTGIGKRCGSVSLLGQKSESNVLWWNPFVMGLSILILAAMTSTTLA